jgi:hypothetical protein
LGRASYHRCHSFSAVLSTGPSELLDRCQAGKLRADNQTVISNRNSGGLFACRWSRAPATSTRSRDPERFGGFAAAGATGPLPGQNPTLISTCEFASRRLACFSFGSHFRLIFRCYHQFLASGQMQSLRAHWPTPGLIRLLEHLELRRRCESRMRMRTPPPRLIVSLGTLALAWGLGGCVMGHDYRRPQIATPAEWRPATVAARPIASSARVCCQATSIRCSTSTTRPPVGTDGA